jgi:hypothetical protein
MPSGSIDRTILDVVAVVVISRLEQELASAVARVGGSALECRGGANREKVWILETRGSVDSPSLLRANPDEEGSGLCVPIRKPNIRCQGGRVLKTSDDAANRSSDSCCFVKQVFVFIYHRSKGWTWTTW